MINLKKSETAKKFAEAWQGKGYEKGDTQKFWLELLQKVLGVEDPYSFVEFEDKVMVDSTNFMDVYLPATRVLIEQKGIGKNLDAPVRQSDGALLNPFQQAKKYIVGLPLSRHPRWVVTCNFTEFRVYDMEQPNGEPQKIFLKDLEKEHYRLQFLVDSKSEHITKEMRVSMQAGEIVGRIYDALLEQYNDTSPEALRWLNILCVRIVFCLYAEDAGVFAHDQFHDYLASTAPEDIREALIKLFGTLNTPVEKRSHYLKPSLAAFPYTNGGLFAEEIEIPQFTDGLKRTLLDNASLDFDWSEISPTIFGAVFESTLNPDTRRKGGMHYTSIENIHKVIDPLFLNDLRHELDEILEMRVEKERGKRLDAYRNKLASLTFLDPACGSGNFLTETYLSLRRLENEAIIARHHGQSFLGLEEVNPIKVSINQFYGIEINDFAVTVATTALWISEAQMLRETEKIVRHDIDFLPLKSYANIMEGNALRLPWDEWEIKDETVAVYAERAYVYPRRETVTKVSEPEAVYGKIDIYADEAVTYSKPKEKQFRHVNFNYIMGNPPFVGYTYQSKSQKEDLAAIMKGFGGNIDYVAGWYLKAAQTMHKNHDTRTALVSTNSITQGEQVAAIWKPLFERYNIHFDFAYRTFRWDSESEQKAHVHCVIIGFSCGESSSKKRIFFKESQIEVTNINPYLLDAPDVFVEKRKTPICDVPPFVRGCQPTDDGNFILTIEEKEELLSKEPQTAPFIRPFMMGKDFIERKPRYCLWLKDANPTLLRQCHRVMERVQNVREFRLGSSKVATRKKAETPTLFDEIRMPTSNYIALPTVSSERRRYIPLDFLPQEIIPGNKIYF
ncbi:MAG: methylase, partial [Bacteroidales bacterium]|nr:methylase [Bacteroidales bacterium]